MLGLTIFLKRYASVLVIVFLIMAGISVQSLNLKGGTDASNNLWVFGTQNYISTSRDNQVFNPTAEGIQLAIEKVNGTGGTVYLPRVNITGISQNIFCNEGVSIKGVENSMRQSLGSYLKFNDGYGLVFGYSGCNGWGGGISDVYIQGGGVGCTGVGINITDLQYFYVKNCRVNSFGTCIRVNEQCHYSEFENLGLGYPNSYNMYVDGPNSVTIEQVNFHTYWNIDAGVYVADGTDGRIKDCWFECHSGFSENASHWVHIKDAGWKLDNCRIGEGARNGTVYFESPVGGTVTGSVIDKCKIWGRGNESVYYDLSNEKNPVVYATISDTLLYGTAQVNSSNHRNLSLTVDSCVFDVQITPSFDLLQVKGNDSFVDGCLFTDELYGPYSVNALTVTGNDTKIGRNSYVGSFAEGSYQHIENSNGKSFPATDVGLQDAINDLNSTNGGKVYLPAATIWINSTINTWTRSINIEGAGFGSGNPPVSNPCTKLRRGGSLGANYIMKVGSETTVSHGFSIHNVLFDGGGSTGCLGGIQLWNVNQATVNRCYFDSFFRTTEPRAVGINLTGDGSKSVGYNTIKDCKIRRATIGIMLNNITNSNQIYGGYITNNRNGDTAGLILRDCDTNTISGVNFEDISHTKSDGAVVIMRSWRATSKHRFFGCRFEGNFINVNISSGAGTGFNSFYSCSQSNLEGGGTNIIDNGNSPSYYVHSFAHVTEQVGTATITNGWGNITHNCSVTPQVAFVQTTEIGEFAQVYEITSTQIKVCIRKYDNSVGTTQQVYWSARGEFGNA